MPRTVPTESVRHALGCPENPDRIERYEATKSDGSKVQVTRCHDCGQMAYDERGAR
jgi:hypothetical protein